MEQILLQRKQMSMNGLRGSWVAKIPLDFLLLRFYHSLLYGKCTYPTMYSANPIKGALRGIAETHVFIPSHFVQIL